MQSVERFDLGSISRVAEHPNGTLRVWGVVSHVGDLVYKNADGSVRREKVTKDELLKPQSFDSLFGIPVVSPHTPQLDPRTDEIKGWTGSQLSVDERNGALAVDLYIRDPAVIQKVKSAKTDGSSIGLSLGYSCGLDERQDGLYQTNRVYRHLAVVDVPRAPGARILLDGDDTRMDAVDPNWDLRLPIGIRVDAGCGCEQCQEAQLGSGKKSKKEKKSMLLNLDGLSVDLPSDQAVAIKNHIDSLESRLDMAMKGKKKPMDMEEDDEDEEEYMDSAEDDDMEEVESEDSIDWARGERDAALARADELQARLDALLEATERDRMDGSAIAAAVRERVQVIAEAGPYLKNQRADELAAMDPNQIRALVLSQMYPSRYRFDDLRAKSPDYLAALWDNRMDSGSARNPIETAIAQGVVPRKDAAAPTDPAAAYNATRMDAWKTPITQ